MRDSVAFHIGAGTLSRPLLAVKNFYETDQEICRKSSK